MERSVFERRVSMALDGLTATEEKLVKYISAHAEEVRGLTSSELAARLSIAQSTVIKFSQKLGYSGYRRMINDISASKPDAMLDQELDFEESDAAIIDNLGQQYQGMFELMRSLNEVSSFQRAAEYIYQADTVILFGYTPKKGHFMQSYASNLLRIGINCFSDAYTSPIYGKLNVCKEKDAIILLSESGETREIVNFAKIARKKGMRVISITRPSRNSLAEISDVNLRIAEYGSRTVLRSTMLQYSYLTVMDILYLLVFKKDVERFEKNAARSSLVTKLNYIEP